LGLETAVGFVSLSLAAIMVREKERRTMIVRDQPDLSLSRQCRLLSIS
jgi:hypothetical protein